MKVFRSFFTGTLIFAVLLTANQATFSQYVCNLQEANTTMISGAITGADPLQTGRINRNGIPSSCTGKTNSLFASTMLRHDAHNFTNPTGQAACVTVDFNATGCGGNTTQAVAYSSYNPATPGVNVIGDFGFSTTGTARFSFPVAAGANFTIVVHEITANSGCPSYTFTVSYRTNCRQPGYDLTNDGQADPTVFRPTTGDWLTLNSAGGSLTQNFGVNGDVPTAGDYTGDQQTDVSVYRPSNNVWYYGNNTTNPGTDFTARPWGTAGDVPVPGDYDSDGIADVAIWRPSNGTWYILQSSNNSVLYQQWGRNGDIPVTADFDGDLKTDFAVIRPDKAQVTPEYNWYILQSNFAAAPATSFIRTIWGRSGDIPVPADYNGDRKADISVFRPSDGTWNTILLGAAQSGAGSTTQGFQWGMNGDIPQPADYDGDGIADVSVFRPSNGTWYWRNSGNNTASIVPWGMSTDVPVTSP